MFSLATEQRLCRTHETLEAVELTMLTTIHYGSNDFCRDLFKAAEQLVLHHPKDGIPDRFIRTFGGHISWRIPLREGALFCASNSG
jgi:hypothetical protein